VDYSQDMKNKYAEGQKIKETFERTMTALFRVPKAEVTKKLAKKRKKGKD
jgi:hypothetical protein